MRYFLSYIPCLFMISFFLYSYRLAIILWTLQALSQFQQHVSLNSYRAVISMWMLPGLSMLMGHQTVRPRVVFFFRTRFSWVNSLKFCATVACCALTLKPESYFHLSFTWHIAFECTFGLVISQFRCWMEWASHTMQSHKCLPNCSGLLYSPEPCTQKQLSSWATALGKFWSAVILWPWLSSSLASFT